mmetsp:Transcript_32189/g.108373  ORF Transcript_32189/g.108373 Transcript_32189/m.108373 type:complete len:224 (+) Transcript_32189:579-1250(+)
MEPSRRRRVEVELGSRGRNRMIEMTSKASPPRDDRASELRANGAVSWLPARVASSRPPASFSFFGGRPRPRFTLTTALSSSWSVAPARAAKASAGADAKRASAMGAGDSTSGGDGGGGCATAGGCSGGAGTPGDAASAGCSAPESSPAVESALRFLERKPRGFCKRSQILCAVVDFAGFKSSRMARMSKSRAREMDSCKSTAESKSAPLTTSGWSGCVRFQVQ